MDSLTPFEPAWGDPESWNLAFDKVEDYLRACRVDSRMHRARLIAGILRRVAERGPRQDRPLTVLAFEETRRSLRDWFSRVVDAPSPSAPGRSEA